MKRVAILLALALSGCASPEKGAPPAPATFAPEEDASSAAVFLRGQTHDDRVTVFVVARGAAELHGIAFRLLWDASRMTYIDTTASGAWSKQSFALAKESTPGQLAVAWSERGDVPGIDATKETVLGTVSFSIHGAKGSNVAFRPERSGAVDRKGRALSVKWLGGAVVAR